MYFLLTASLLLLPPALAGTATADDTDAGMFYSGLWVPDGDPNTFGHHDTWTNQTGASVTFDFIGEVESSRYPDPHSDNSCVILADRDTNPGLRDSTTFRDISHQRVLLHRRGPSHSLDH